MSFPAMNAKSVVYSVSSATGLTTTGILGTLATGPYNLFSVPAVVDVSGMEYSFSVVSDSSSGAAGIQVETHDNSRNQIALSYGGPTGDNTTVSVLAADITNTATAFTDTQPRDVSGTSTTDLDADDWVNLHIVKQAAGVAGIGQAHVSVNYIYGKPGSIN